MLNPVSETVEQALRQHLPAAAFRSLEPHYLEEPRGRYAGRDGLVVAPGQTSEVAHVIRMAAEARVPVIPYGGGTGLVGGQIAEDGPKPIILSFERMTKVRSVSPLDNTMVVEAGAILADVQAAAEEVDRLFPLSLASEGSARIGGLLATNAGGVNVLRYGNARDLCLGLEAVLPDGSVLQGLKRLRKDNTGYDLRHLLIGAEGTLGVVTAATLRLYPRPQSRGAALMVVPDPDTALKLLALAQAELGESVSAFELIGRMGLMFLEETEQNVKQPFDPKPDWMVLIDVGAGAGQSANAALEGLFERAYMQDLVSDGVIAQSEADRLGFWALRETLPIANRAIGSVSSHDISVPLDSIPEFIRKGGEVLAGIGDFRINCFGHVGDGNLHYNVFPQPGRSRADHEVERPQIKRALHDLAHALGGSVSAEHGIGRLKVADLERYGDPAKLAAMAAVKAALDPVGIMNPGAVLRAR
ncbi:MAG: FAD-binding oxidoreductase [Pseudomonadota bacterium]